MFIHFSPTHLIFNSLWIYILGKEIEQLDSKKIFKTLKWKPKIDFDEGLIKTIKWYLENKPFLNQISKKKYEKRLGLSI